MSENQQKISLKKEIDIELESNKNDNDREYFCTESKLMMKTSCHFSWFLYKLKWNFLILKILTLRVLSLLLNCNFSLPEAVKYCYQCSLMMQNINSILRQLFPFCSCFKSTNKQLNQVQGLINKTSLFEFSLSNGFAVGSWISPNDSSKFFSTYFMSKLSQI